MISGFTDPSALLKSSKLKIFWADFFGVLFFHYLCLTLKSVAIEISPMTEF